MNSLRAQTRDLLVAAGLDPDDVVTVISRAVTEDHGEAGDLTSQATIAAEARTEARYVARQTGVVAGLPVLSAIVDTCLAEEAELEIISADGDLVEEGATIAVLRGDTRGALGIERLSLNLLGHLSGIATVTHAWVQAVSGTSARIRDTRKTIPGLRDLEKYAVRCGGGVNHRRGLDDAVLIKDNHVVSAGGVGAALDRVAAAYPSGGLVVQVEVDDFGQLEEALAHGAKEILLDNFSVSELEKAVAVVRARSSEVKLEASGGLQLANAREVAATGVDYLAVGALTHSAPVLDIGLDS